MAKRNIVVIGASAGGFAVIKELIAGLPANSDLIILIVWHISPEVRGILPHVLNQNSKIYAAHGIDNEVLTPGRIYIAPPDRHMIVDGEVIRITKGPKENRFRPAIDPLFRSAAYFHGPRVIGVVLSGALDDGTAGLWTIKKNGGLAIVQDPQEAEVDSMPRSAIEGVTIDHITQVHMMPSLIMRLSMEDVPEVIQLPIDQERTKTEIRIAMEENEKYNVLKQGQLTQFTCPECHGVLVSIVDGGRSRFRCHTGHAFSADSLLTSITENVEERLWTAIRSMQETVFLLNHMGDHFSEANQPKLAALYFKKAKSTERRISLARQAVMQHELLSARTMKSDVQLEKGE
jgi:two-component system chemotaxis response regulator CheB